MTATLIQFPARQSVMPDPLANPVYQRAYAKAVRDACYALANELMATRDVYGDAVAEAAQETMWRAMRKVAAPLLNSTGGMAS